MSGSLRYLPKPLAHGAHDHVDLKLTDGGCLRYNDPRRFGSLLLTREPHLHPLLKSLGPEPFSDEFTADYLWESCRGRHVAIKPHLMNGHIVVGVGNIYASEALFRAGIRPTRQARRVPRALFEPLVTSIRDVLTDAINDGGTTLRNYVGGDGEPGYFRTALKVYERDDQ